MGGNCNTRPKRRAVHGVFLLDKPSGLTSNAALQQVRRLFRAEKAGHTGTLDPFAEGLLPVALGEASKFASWQLHADKTYRADVLLGVRTTTGDLEGETVQTRPVDVDRAAVERALAAFRGDISQVPPMYSALKVDGRPMYEYARAGIELVREARTVQIHALDLIAFDAPRMSIEVRCSAGTYIRTLAEDIGEQLGCGAHLTRLVRLGSGGFELQQAHGINWLEQVDETVRDDILLPVDALVAHLPRLDVAADIAQDLLHGRHPQLHTVAAGMYRIYDGTQFAGLAERDERGIMFPRRMMSVGMALES